MSARLKHYEESVKLVQEENKATVSLLQGEFRIGYRKARALLDAMEYYKVIGRNEHGQRKIL